MGCTFAKSSAHGDNNPRVFHVHNVDDHGQEFKRGKIEINDQDLILFQKGKEAIRWPLRSLRRYGFDAELFSFESGRRCPTGPGIYAFKCQRAEALFNLLQEFIVRAGQEDHRQTNPTSDVPVQQGGRSRHGSSSAEVYTQFQDSPNSNARHDYMNGNIRTHEYVNTPLSGANQPTVYNQVLESGQPVTYCVHRSNSHCAHTTRRDASSQQHVIQYAELDLPKTAEDGSEEGASGPLPNGAYVTRPGGIGADDEESSQAMYINVPATEIKRPSLCPPSRGRLSSLPKQPGDDPSCYTQLSSLNGSSSRGNSLPLRMDTVPMNYIQLDLHNSVENVNGGGGGFTPASPASPTSTPDSTVAKTDSYAMIDFDRTQALQLHARPAVTSEEEGMRKTRHNSNIDELN